MDAGRVLIVDDEADARERMVRGAEGFGLRASAVASAAEFKAAYVDEEPDVVVIDMLLTREDGLDLTAWLARRNSSSRVVLVSDRDPLYTRTAVNVAQASGVDAQALRAPFSLHDLRTALIHEARPA